jgi:hypothetical protein
LLEYEVWNWIHVYRLGRSHADQVQALQIRVALVEMTAAVLARALEPFPIRTLDVLHLSTIEYVRNRRKTVELASYDRRLLAAAQALGIAIAAL